MLSINKTFSTKFELQQKINIAANIDTNEAFPDRKTNPADFDKLEGCNPKWPRIAGPDQSAAKKMRPGHCTIKKSIPDVPWVDLSRDRYIALTKLATPARNTFGRRLLFT